MSAGRCRECKTAWTATAGQRKTPFDMRQYRRGWEFGEELICDPCLMRLVFQALRESPPPKAA